MSIYNGSDKASPGDYQYNRLDMADIEQYPEFNQNANEQKGPSRGGKIIHEIREQFGKALDGRKRGDADGYLSNHLRAISWENDVNQNERQDKDTYDGKGWITTYKLQNGSEVKFRTIGLGSKKVLIIEKVND